MILRSVPALLLIVLLAGCLYPDELRKENQIPPGEWIGMVQNAVEQYHQNTGVLPIQTKPMNTPIYQKYPIDFRKLLGTYLGTIPANAFENGGNYQYVLVDPETEPKVKLLDLAVLQKVGDIQRWVDEYKSEHGGQLPVGEPAAPHFYTLDFNKLGKKAEQIKSFYSPQYLTFILHETGVVAIDYGPEIMKALTEQGAEKPNTEGDLRRLLVMRSHFVPVCSYPYYWQNNEPVVAEK